MRGERAHGLRQPLRQHGSAARLVVACGVLAVALLVAPLAQARHGEALSLNVTFSTGGAIAVTLPDGTPVGVSTGSPTVIPAGYYTLFLSGPGCVNVPFFTLRGPGVNISDNLEEGEVTSDSYTADFQANSTYTWTDEATPGVVYTFQTSSSVLGTPTPLPDGGYAVSNDSGTAASSDPIGSGASASPALSVKGSLTAAVSAAGKLSLLYKGKAVTTLPPGRYTVSVNDKSRTNGFMLERVGHAPLSLIKPGKVGKASATVDLTSGQWFFAAHAAGVKTYFIVLG